MKYVGIYWRSIFKTVRRISYYWHRVALYLRRTFHWRWTGIFVYFYHEPNSFSHWKLQILFLFTRRRKNSHPRCLTGWRSKILDRTYCGPCHIYWFFEKTAWATTKNGWGTQTWNHQSVAKTLWSLRSQISPSTASGCFSKGRNISYPSISFPGSKTQPFGRLVKSSYGTTSTSIGPVSTWTFHSTSSNTPKNTNASQNK